MGFMVPGSTFRYGSSFWIVSLRPRASSSEPMEAEASPLPRDDTTPPETKMNFVFFAAPRGEGALIATPGWLRYMRQAPLARFRYRVSLFRRCSTREAIL